MKPLQKTLAMIAFLVLASQTVRHAYMLWLEPRGSVLDKYDQPTREQISAAASLDELLRRYDVARKQVDLAKQERAKAAVPSNPPFVNQMEQNQREPFKSEAMLREAVNEWERKSKEIRAIRFYWLVGLGFSLLGTLVYWKWNRWFGLALLVAAFSEFIYWTSPTFLGDTREFDRLLVIKLALSVVSFVLLVAAIRFFRIFAEEGADRS